MLSGVDLSVWQHPEGKPIDYAKAVAKGVDFAIIEYKDESSSENPFFEADHAGFKAAGAMTGSYVFLRPELPIVAQAEDLRMLAKYGPVWGDLEVTGGKNKKQLQAWWEQLVSAAGPHVGMVTYPSFITSYGPFASTSPLWVDSFGAPKAPANEGLMIWGTTDKASVPGIPAAVDMDAFTGSKAQFSAIFGDHTVAPAPGRPRGKVIGSAGGPLGFFVAYENGDVLPYGDCAYHGSPDLDALPAVNAVSFHATPSLRGYRVVMSNGAIDNFGDARTESAHPSVA